MGGKGVLMSGIAPNPIADAEELIRREASLPVPPDCYLVMPLTGVGNAEGIFRNHLDMAERLGRETGARFILFEEQTERETAVRLLRESEHFIGLKIGTDVGDVTAIVEASTPERALLYGGSVIVRPDQQVWVQVTLPVLTSSLFAHQMRSTTRSAAVIWKPHSVEDEIAAFEDIRFRDGRMYYSAVVEACIWWEAMRLTAVMEGL